MNEEQRMEEKFFLIRADGNVNIGMGHIMRCLSIAEAAKRQGWKSIFLVSDSACKEVIQERGYLAIVLNSDYIKLDCELPLIQLYINKYNCSLFLIDSYFATFNYLTVVKAALLQRGGKLICMDGNASFPYPCDMLINYNIYGSTKKNELIASYSGMVKKGNCSENYSCKIHLPKFLLGTKYVPLRSEFRDLPDRKVNITATNILISTGATDIEHIALNLVQEIFRVNTSFQFHIVLGLFNKDVKEIRSLASKCNNIYLYSNIKNIHEVMQKMDVAISASGSTLYELCATQTPTITYVLADNQLMGAKEFNRIGLMRYVGDIRETGCQRMAGKLITEALNLANDYESRLKLAKEMKKTVDKHGADNIIKEIVKLFCLTEKV